MGQAKKRREHVQALVDAVEEFLKNQAPLVGRELQLAGALEEFRRGDPAPALAEKPSLVLGSGAPATEGPSFKFTCPHCDAEDPSYGWHLNAGDTGPFALTYVTCFCGECRAILSVSITSFMPSKEIAEALMKQFQNRLAGQPGPQKPS